MKLSDDKVSQLTHEVLKGLMDKGLITLREDASLLRREIKRTILSELKAGDELDEAVRRKLQTFSRKLIEGSPEWEILYRKLYEEEEVKRGRR